MDKGLLCNVKAVQPHLLVLLMSLTTVARGGTGMLLIPPSCASQILLNGHVQRCFVIADAS